MAWKPRRHTWPLNPPGTSTQPLLHGGLLQGCCEHREPRGQGDLVSSNGGSSEQPIRETFIKSKHQWMMGREGRWIRSEGLSPDIRDILGVPYLSSPAMLSLGTRAEHVTLKCR